MFSKTIFKQTLKSNIRLWFIFTAIMVAMSSLIIAIFNPSTMDQMMSMMERIIEDPAMLAQVQSGFSLLNMLSMQFYSGMGIILVLIYLIITANSLIASQVDRGSMAYILSTPIKRTTVTITQGAYLIIALTVMFGTLALSGLLTAQISHGGIFFRTFTSDVKAVANYLDMSNAQIADDLSIILENPEAITIGAEARNIDTDVYVLYLQMLIANQQGQGTAPQQTPEEREQADAVQTSFTNGIEAAAEVLEMEANALFFNLGLIKDNPAALSAAAYAAEMHEMQFVAIINMQLANEEVLLDSRFNFDVRDYLLVNLGLFLLMFATSAISFFFSCLFNLTKNSIALGAGIPIAFYIFQTMASVGDDMEFFRYLTLNTLYNPQRILSGDSFWVPFAILATIGCALYAASVKIFKEKDLPL